jgi:hypothetical protein
MREFPIVNYNGDKIGTVRVSSDTADAIAANWEHLSIEPTVLRGMIDSTEIYDQLVGFFLVAHPAVEADLPCGPCDCGDCTGASDA